MIKRDYMKEYNKTHRQQLNEYKNSYNLDPVHREVKNALARSYYQKNKATKLAKVNEYQKERKRNDVQFRIAFNLRARLAMAIKKGQKAGSAVSDLGCSIPELKSYLEGKFTDGMSWDKRAEIHIDHIIPLSSFDLSNREQLLKAVHYTNLQPLWAIDNLRKGNKLVVN